LADILRIAALFAVIFILLGTAENSTGLVDWVLTSSLVELLL
jgi:hypothetical protein